MAKLSRSPRTPDPSRFSKPWVYRLVLPCISPVIRCHHDTLCILRPVCCSATVNSSSGSWPHHSGCLQTLIVPWPGCLEAARHEPQLSQGDTPSQMCSLPLSFTVPLSCFGDRGMPQQGWQGTAPVSLHPTTHSLPWRGSDISPGVPMALPMWVVANEMEPAAVLYNKFLFFLSF